MENEMKRICPWGCFRFLLCLFAGGLFVVEGFAAQAQGGEIFVENQSYITPCAEEDNVNIPVFGQDNRFRIVALHPLYDVGIDSCAPDFSGCDLEENPTTVQVDDTCQSLWDDGTTVVELCTMANWWRPYTMGVTVDNRAANGHYLRLYRKVENEGSWPQFLVLYQDGNLRLIPHPPEGRTSVCFGSSVVVGPAVLDQRPYADILNCTVTPSPLALDLTYRDGGSAHLDLSVDRSRATAEVLVDYSMNSPFATFRSMWVEDGNADVDHIQNPEGDHPILGEWDQLNGTWWVFHRSERSRKNTSAPDIQIVTGPLPALSLNVVGSTTFSPGDQLNLNAIVTPGSIPSTGDVYVALELPDSTLLFLKADGSFTSSMQPLVQDWTASAIAGKIFSYTFGNSEPEGKYTWYTGMTESGTLNFKGQIAALNFTFSR